MGRPKRKTAAKQSDDSQPQKCNSCTTRLKAPTAVYHTGEVGRYCHIAAEIKRKAGEAKKAAKADAEKQRKEREVEIDLSDGRRTRSASRDRHKAKAEQLEKELAALKKKADEKPKRKAAKRKRSRSSSSDREASSSSSSGSESESKEDRTPVRKHRRKDTSHARWRSTKKRKDPSRNRRDHAPTRRSDEHQLPTPAEMAKAFMAPNLMAAIPGLAGVVAPKKSGEMRSHADRAPDGSKWPHEWVKSAQQGVVVSPHNITLADYVYGYMKCIGRADIANSPYLIEQLEVAMQDVGRYGWETVRRVQLTLFQQIEAGEITWPETGGMAWFQTKMGIFNAPGPATVHTSRSESTDPCKSNTVIKKTKVNPCPAFQLNSCERSGDHDGLKHVCAYHYKTQGGRHLFPHGEVDCKLKQAHIPAKQGAAFAEH